MIIDDYPLFPLRSLLFPGGRMALQVFEARYLDLVTDCMREDSGFGVCLILEGDEVVRKQEQRDPSIAKPGVEARIVQWDGMPNNRLALTIEGQRRFEIIDTHVQSDRLMRASIRWQEREAEQPLPEAYLHLAIVLEALLEHPMLQRLEVSADLSSAVSVCNLLSQYLPLAEPDKLALLQMDLDARMAQLSQLLQGLGDGRIQGSV